MNEIADRTSINEGDLAGFTITNNGAGDAAAITLNHPLQVGLVTIPLDGTSAIADSFHQGRLEVRDQFLAGKISRDDLLDAHEDCNDRLRDLSFRSRSNEAYDVSPSISTITPAHGPHRCRRSLRCRRCRPHHRSLRCPGTGCR